MNILDDPEMPEETESFKEEMYKTFHSMGWKPEDIKKEGYRDGYREWLKKNE